MTLPEFERDHPRLARDLRHFSGDHTTGRNLARWEMKWPDRAAVSGVYDAYEDGVQVWYAIIDEGADTNMAVFKEGKWTWSE